MSELYDINELPDGTFPLSSNLLYLYQKEDPLLSEKIKYAEYQKGYFCGGHNNI